MSRKSLMWLQLKCSSTITFSEFNAQCCLLQFLWFNYCALPKGVLGETIRLFGFSHTWICKMYFSTGQMRRGDRSVIVVQARKGVYNFGWGLTHKKRKWWNVTVCLTRYACLETHLHYRRSLMYFYEHWQGFSYWIYIQVNESILCSAATDHHWSVIRSDQYLLVCMFNPHTC